MFHEPPPRLAGQEWPIMNILTLRSVICGLLLACACMAGLLAPAVAGAVDIFPRATARGMLKVGVIHVTPAAEPGAKRRTEDRLDTPVVHTLAKALNLPAQMIQIAPADAAAALAAGTIDLALYSLPAGARTGAHLAAIPTSYITYPKAVIRSDTRIHSLADLRGRSVCVARTADLAAREAARAGARPLSFPVPSDALVAVREGKCDLGLIDQTVWQDLMHFPEWKKFSATLDLPARPLTLAWLVPAKEGRQVDWLRKQMQQWDRNGQWAAFSKKWATDVAFDVYLDQEVPDCHG